jgi:hypothetical protein
MGPALPALFETGSFRNHEDTAFAMPLGDRGGTDAGQGSWA